MTIECVTPQPWRFAGVLVLLILLSASHAYAQAVISDMGYYRVDTLNYFLNHFPGNIPMSLCDGTDCTHFVGTNGGQINTSDFTAGQYVYIQAAADGEAFTFEAVAPDGSIWGKNTLTYSASTLCFTWSGSTSDRATEPPPTLCGNTCGSNPCVGPYVYAWSGPTLPCIWNGTPLAGTWTLKVIDSDNPGSPLTHTFSLQHNQNSQLGIISPIPQSPQLPLDNALVDLAADRNWTATDATCPGSPNPLPATSPNLTSACYSAATKSGNPINWTAQLNYATSGGLAKIFDPPSGPLNFQTSSGQSQVEVYQNEGGQVKVTAKSTASDGSAIEDCTTFYVEGPAGGIPNANITSQLVNSYQASGSYPKDGTATYNLMTGVGYHESTYTQFRTPAECNFDLWSLDANLGILAKWPYESEVKGTNNQCVSDGGTHIGLMQLQTAANQQLDPNAWKWADASLATAANANDAVNLFSGYVSPNKMTIASGYENDIFSGVNTPPIPAHVGMDSTRTPLSGLQLENMALVLYRGAGLGPDLTSTLMELYYIPVCTPPGTISSSRKGWTCSTNWYWAVNDPTVDQNVQAKYIFPPNTSGKFGNHVGVAYVSNGILFNDGNFGPGVRKQLQQ